MHPRYRCDVALDQPADVAIDSPVLSHKSPAETYGDDGAIGIVLVHPLKRGPQSSPSSVIPLSVYRHVREERADVPFGLDNIVHGDTRVPENRRRTCPEIIAAAVRLGVVSETSHVVRTGIEVSR